MPAHHTTPMSPPPNAVASSSAAAMIGSGKATPPPQPPQPHSPSSSSSVHQVGSRQATRTRTRTRRNVSSSTSGSHRTPRYTNEDHPLAPHNLASRGYHSFRCLGVPFHVKQRYTFVRELGIGAYGCVALCRDEVLECNVAIKKVTRIFEKDVLARRALREVALLRHIGLCDNVTALLDFDTAFIDFSEIYLVLSASEADLSQIIRSGQSLSDAHHQYFMAQILRGVRYMHSAKVIHRDLKPSNLLVNGDCALRICDLGLARAYADSHEFLAPPATTNDDTESKPRSSIGSSVEDDRTDARQSSPDTDAAQAQQQHQQQQQPRSGSARSPSPASDLHVQLYKTDLKGKQKRLNYPGGPLTGYVATRWYRAPEVMLCFREGYGPEMDMWSVGCILAELIAGAPIFGGKDYVDQIARINNVLGSPSEAVLDKIGSERAKTYIKSLPHMPAVPLEKLYPNANPEALDLVAKLLTWDPDQRLTAEEALRHPWLKAYHESNARWQPPQPFDKFAEVEFIHSLRQFKTSLQREADEMRMELEELEREELEHLGDSKANGESNGNSNGEHHEAHQDSEPVVANGQNGHHAANAEAEVSTQTEEEEEASTEQQSGNVQGADEVADLRAQSDERRGVDADAPHSDFPPYYHASGDEDADSDSHDVDALSCNASSQSESLPADTASSSSSIHTPSSISGASADEAEPASPRMYETCAMSTALKSRAEHLEEGKALRKPPSFFRLGHEVEGRRSAGAFMPHQVLTVARGLVEYQTTAANAMRDSTWLPSPENAASTLSRQPQDGMRSRSDTIKASSLSNSGSTVADGKAAGASAAGTSTSSSSSRGGSASTPSIGQSLLDDMPFAPADGSSSGLKIVSSQRHGKQLVVLQDSIVQSAVSLVRDLIARSAQRNHAVLLVTTLRSPATYLDGYASDRVAVIDATTLGDVFAVDAGVAVKTVGELVERIRSQLSALNANVTKMTVVIDSLNAVAHAAGDDTGVAMASRVVRETLGSVGASSRVVVGLQMGGVEASTHAGLLSTLHSPLIWGAASAAGAWGTLLSVSVHAPALLRHVYKQYGLKPPSTPAAGRRALGFDGGDDADEVDARFWDVLKNVACRGPMGVAAYEAGGGTQGWWTGEGCAFESLGVVESGGSESEASSVGVITLADLLNPARTGYAVLELHYHARTGKTHEELVGLVSSPATQLVPLDMVDHATTATITSAATPAAGDAHASMMSTLPFNLGETTDQRERRETVPLPYAYHQHQEPAAAAAALRGTTGNAHIFFEPEQDDDEDDEDPDDDLDL